MNSVGIDISKGRSMVAVMRPFGEVVVSPFEVRHTDSELSELAKLLKSLDGETRVVMEATGNYHTPVAWLLHGAGLYVSVVNAKLVHGYGNNDLRRVKTDRKDAVKLANYGLDRWLTLPRYIPEEDTRLLLKNCYRQYQQYSKVQTMLKNNLISLLDTTFPGMNRLFNTPARADGSEKWVDFAADFWHCGCVCECSEKVFMNKYQRWCRKHGYNFSERKALEFTPRPVDTLALCQCPIPQSYLWLRPCPNSEQPQPHLPYSSRRCKHWLPNCRNIPLSWRCSELVQPLAHNSWPKLAMYAVSTLRKLLWPTPVLMPHRMIRAM